MATEKDEYILDISVEGIQDLGSKFSSVKNNIGDTKNVFKELKTGVLEATKASLAFIATPLGLFITALVTGFALLRDWISKSTAALDFIEDVTMSVSTAFNVLLDNLDKVADVALGLGRILMGDLKGGFAQITEGAKALGDEIQREVEATIRLNNALRDLEDREINLKIANSENVNQIKEYIKASGDRNKTEEERIALLDKASELQKKNSDEAKSISEGNLKAVTELAGNTKNLYQTANEGASDYAKRLIASGELIDAERDKVVDALIAFNQAQTENLALTEAISIRRTQLIEDAKAKAEADKALRDEERRAESEFTLQLAENTILKQGQTEIKLVTDFGKARNVQYKRSREEQMKIGREFDALVIQQEQAKEAQLEQLRNNALILGQTIFQKNKVAQSGLTAISTYFSAQKAFESQFLPVADVTSPFRGAIAAALTVGQGLARVAAINNIKFARGGNAWNIGGKSHSSGGTKFWGEDGTHFEAEANEGLYILKKDAQADLINKLSDQNTRFGGTSFNNKVSYAAYGGQIETSRAADSASSSRELVNVITEAVRNMPRPVVFVEDINTGQNNLNEVQVIASA